MKTEVSAITMCNNGLKKVFGHIPDTLLLSDKPLKGYKKVAFKLEYFDEAYYGTYCNGRYSLVNFKRPRGSISFRLGPSLVKDLGLEENKISILYVKAKV